MKLKQIALFVCIVFIITAILQIITVITLIVQKVNFADKVSFIWPFWSIILWSAAAYFFYSFYKKIK
ncbi:hypothetical protein [uncultured Alistipes sp.]|uniref:hypothetical protein n=1 Tax=uncultured Alistipes sp. TaxID=538949 RepID=UPI0026076BE7|nr:hypothetical protein [uncultured Alistipes sp.]